MGRLPLLLLAVLLLLSAASDDLLRALQAIPTPSLGRSRMAKGKVDPAPAADPDSRLAHKHLVVPVQGIARTQLRDTFSAGRSGGRSHKAIDIMAARGTPVLAADDGKVAKISSNRGGGLAVYQVDDSGEFVYYYAHLDHYAQGLRDGQPLHRGDVIGYVGSTGNAPASAPHLHFAVLILTEPHRWWGGESLNPYPAFVQGETVTAARH